MGRASIPPNTRSIRLGFRKGAALSRMTASKAPASRATSSRNQRATSSEEGTALSDPALAVITYLAAIHRIVVAKAGNRLAGGRC
jgi:hypothetical protein